MSRLWPGMGRRRLADAIVLSEEELVMAGGTRLWRIAPRTGSWVIFLLAGTVLLLQYQHRKPLQPEASSWASSPCKCFCAPACRYSASRKTARALIDFR